MLIYTSESKLCTSYRQTFRPIYPNETYKSIAKRHSKYFFLSRYLYESIDIHGLVLDTKEKVYHGIDKTMLFSHFLSHFNAPTSTTKELSVAMNFAKDSGIILE
eukprot:61955_1